jgi:hypothetical protein
MIYEVLPGCQTTRFSDKSRPGECQAPEAHGAAMRMTDLAIKKADGCAALLW